MTSRGGSLVFLLSADVRSADDVIAIKGQLFFLPNMTFGQPPYYVNQMIAASYQPQGLSVSGGRSDNSVTSHPSIRESAQGC